MKTDLFQFYGHCWRFQLFWHIECSTSTVSSFRIWNSSAGIPSPPLALFIVMSPKIHWTSHSRMLGSRWVFTPSWLSGLQRVRHDWAAAQQRYLLNSSSVYSCHLFLIASPLLGPYCLCPLWCPSLHEIFPWYLRFSWRSLVFRILLFSSISLHWSLRKTFFSLLSILCTSTFRWVYLSFSPSPFASLLSY